MTYRFRQFVIPEHVMPALLRWIEHGVPPGSFLSAVLENNLKEAVGNADADCLANLPALVGYLYNEAPAMCWGSPERVAAWPAFLLRRREPA
jgi:hypothetical protein